MPAAKCGEGDEGGLLFHHTITVVTAEEFAGFEIVTQALAPLCKSGERGLGGGGRIAFSTAFATAL